MGQTMRTRGRMATSIKRVAAASAVAASLCGAALVASSSAAWASPTISAVQFTGDTTSNTITITGSGFGADPPSGTSDNVNGCGTYTNNGEDYIDSLMFQGDTFTAGQGFPNEGSCVGLIVDRWTDTQVVLAFGNAYNTFAGWNIVAGQGFTMTVEGATFGGTVAFAGSSTTTPCPAHDSCTAVAGSTNEDVVVTGTSSTSGSITIAQTTAKLECGPAYDYTTAVNKVSESNFTSKAPLTVVDVIGKLPSAKGLKVCFQPLGASPPPPAFLKKCGHPAVAPCTKALAEVDGSAVATLLVPANDPRYWVGGGTPGLGAFTPTSGVVGTKVTLKGQRLSEVLSVLFGSTPARIVKETPTAVIVTVPAGATSGHLTVVSTAGQSVSTKSFTVKG